MVENFEGGSPAQEISDNFDIPRYNSRRLELRSEQATAAVRVLLDHNVPKRLRPFLSMHDVRLAREMHWAELTTVISWTFGKRGFAAFVTADKNLPY